jgi:lysyl-tRNA synthetase class 2
MSTLLSEQEIVRRESLQKLVDLGIDPYPAHLYEVDEYSTSIKSGYNKDASQQKKVKIAGRLMSRRIMGKAAFAELQDSKGRIQLYFNRDEICSGEDKTMYNTVFKKLLDIGDFIGVEGYVFTTKVGEISVHVENFIVLTKTLRPLPLPKTDNDGNVHDAFTDPEKRYRQRYIDLVVNPQVKDAFVKRTKLTNSMREFLNDSGYLEVETPILQPIYGGASARPFKTHHNTLDMPLYLRIANELYLKRLIVGGFDGVYEFSKDFRNEGMSRFHNPEFTQVELYVAYKDYNWMMDLVEEMVEKIAIDLHGKTEVQVGDNVINFQRPWKRFTMYEAIEHFTGVDISKMDEQTMAKAAKDLGVDVDSSMGRGKLIDEIFGDKCEGQLIQPTFITRWNSS